MCVLRRASHYFSNTCSVTCGNPLILFPSAVSYILWISTYIAAEHTLTNTLYATELFNIEIARSEAKSLLRRAVLKAGLGERFAEGFR